jgi:hypothetical protein
VLGCISVVVVEGACVRDYRDLWLCQVGIVSWTAGDECVGVRVSLVTGWGIMGGESEGLGQRLVEKGQNELLRRGTIYFSTGEGGRVKGLRVGMRRL